MKYATIEGFQITAGDKCKLFKTRPQAIEYGNSLVEPYTIRRCTKVYAALRHNPNWPYTGPKTKPRQYDHLGNLIEL